ncbi:hypothetical protein SAMN06295888_1613 [Desulfonatronum zhilinae]|nr:hypothetical protein SAMN06295888_1613 [Desulfonatronum zhilinae]
MNFGRVTNALTVNVKGTLNGQHELAALGATGVTRYDFSDARPSTGSAAGVTMLDNPGNAVAIVGSAGNDILRGSNFNDDIRVSAGTNLIFTNNGADTVRLSGGVNTVNVAGDGSVNNIIATGGTNTVTLLGAATVNAATSTVGLTLNGSSVGGDVLIGGQGSDIITGGAGADNMTGNGGNNVFRYTATNIAGITAEGGDTIVDFTIGSDKLQFNNGLLTDLFDTRIVATVAGVGGTSIAAADLIIWNVPGGLVNVAALDAAMAAQNGSAARAAFIVYENTTTGQTTLAYDSALNAANGAIVDIANLTGVNLTALGLTDFAFV